MSAPRRPPAVLIIAVGNTRVGNATHSVACAGIAFGREDFEPVDLGVVAIAPLDDLPDEGFKVDPHEILTGTGWEPDQSLGMHGPRETRNGLVFLEVPLRRKVLT